METLIAEIDVGTFKWIVGGMAVAIVGLAGYIVSLHRKINAMYQERIKSLEEKMALINLLGSAGGVNAPGQGGGNG